MIEIKQMQFLAACVETNSFSRAAQILYTTQSSVSKVIRSLEEELGFELFERNNHGITLTDRGKRVYEYAKVALENVQALSDYARMDEGEEFLVTCNPSSWMAEQFARFYNEHKGEKVCYRYMTASTEEIVRRISEGMDDIGFVHIMSNQLEVFERQLTHNGLCFTPLKKIRAFLYVGDKNPIQAKETITEVNADDVKLVQCFEDEFTLNHYWDLRNKQNDTSRMKVQVVTNSDYVMNALLQNTELCNISGENLGTYNLENKYRSISLYGEDTPVLFGYIQKQGDPLAKWAKRYLEFIKERLMV